MEEEWRAIPGYEGLYEASNLGRVQSLTRRIRLDALMPNRGMHLLGTRVLPGRVLKPQRNPQTGYWQVNLTKNGRPITKRVHNLIACTFLGPKTEGFEVNHKIGNKANNSVDNLEYVTDQQNKQHAKANGLNTFIHPNYGLANPATKLTPEKVLAIRASSESSGILARRFGVSIPTIKDIRHRRSWAYL